MRKLLIIIFLFTSGCYYGYDIVSLPNYLQGHTYEVKHYDTLKVYSYYSTYSKDDARYNALIECQNDNQNRDACLDYSYTQEGHNGPINRESYWEGVKQGYLNSNKLNTEQDYTKITEWSSINEDNIKIVKAKPKKIEKKIAKKDEVKIKKKKQKISENKVVASKNDNSAPIINLKNEYQFKDSSYVISGSVTDESSKVYVDVDGRIIKTEDGKFTIKRFSPINEELSISATDQWGNRSETKLVKIKIDLNQTIASNQLEPLNPLSIKSSKSSNRVALIIGIEKYAQAPSADYANLDAKYFYEYAKKSFGVSSNNIKMLIDEEANLIQSLGTLGKWLPGKIQKNKTELIIFFAGHGLASSDGKELYILPQDSDPDLLTRTALSRTELFQEILELNPKSVTMFMDTCYSGISRDEKTLLASARPIRIIASEEQDVPNNFTIFSASQLDQISSGIKEAKHGIFSYYLMKGLEGNADANKDRKITNGELLAYMDENISQKASELGRQQNPTLAGDPEKVLISYR